jgi:hypothetical protein
MLIEQGGDLVLLELIRHPGTNISVLTLCQMVVKTLAQKKFLSPTMVEGLSGTSLSVLI